MIIHKEQVDYVWPDGTKTKKLIVSYVNKEGKISFLQYPIPKEQYFEWKYCSEKNADPPFFEYDYENKCYKTDEHGNRIQRQWRSYDNKPVARYPIKGDLPDNRINELFCSFGKQLDPVFEMNNPDTWFCDIETEVDASGFPDPTVAATQINTISMTKFPRTIIWSRKNLTEDEKVWVRKEIEEFSEKQCSDPGKKDITKGYEFEFRYFPTEREMLQDFVKFCIPITAICGWNFLDFDWLFIYNRCEKNGIDLKVLSPTRQEIPFKITPRAGGATINVMLPKHKAIFDYLLVFKTWDMTVDHCENHKLDYIANRVLTVGKKEHAWGFAEGFESHFADYVAYNCIDTIILEQIDKAIHTANIYWMLDSELRLINMNDTFSTIKPAETVMANFVYADYKVFPTKKRDIPKEQADYEGAFVWPTRPGIFKMIGGLDFASLYPSIMRQFGISPEVFLFDDKVVVGKDEKGKDIKKVGDYVPKDNEVKTASGAVFRKDKKAMIPAILTHYFAERKQAKKDMKRADTERQYYQNILNERTSMEV